MLKRSDNIDPGTQEYGTSLDVPGTTKSVGNTPVAKTGPKSQTPTGEMAAKSDRHRHKHKHIGHRPAHMRKSDFGVRIAMDTNYVAGFMDKCASAGVDPELLVKEAINWAGIGNAAGKAWGAVKPVLQRLNPWNIVTGTKGLLANNRGKSALLRDMNKRITMSDPSAASDLVGLNTRANAALASHPRMLGVNRRLVESGKNLAGGIAGTAGAGLLARNAVGGAAPEPEPDAMSRMRELLSQYS